MYISLIVVACQCFLIDFFESLPQMLRYLDILHSWTEWPDYYCYQFITTKNIDLWKTHKASVPTMFLEYFL